MIPLITILAVLTALGFDVAGAGPCIIATYSLIIIDPRKKEIGIAGASCTYNCHDIGGIVPGKGAIVVQAMSNKKARARGLEMISSGASPEQIISALKQPEFHPERQQYAVACIEHLESPAACSGEQVQPFARELTGHGISAQGNKLAGSEAINAIFHAAETALKEGLSVHAVLMRGLQAGAWAGGDKRCREQKATTAFITVAGPDDKPGEPYLDLSISGLSEGGANAVNLLKDKYDQWLIRTG